MRVDFLEGRNGGSTVASAKRPVLLDASRSKSKNPRGTTELFKLGQFPNMVPRDTKNGQETGEVERLDGGLKEVEGPGSGRLEGAEWSALWGSATIGVAVLDDRGNMVEANGAWQRPASENRLVRDWHVGRVTLLSAGLLPAPALMRGQWPRDLEWSFRASEAEFTWNTPAGNPGVHAGL